MALAVLLLTALLRFLWLLVVLSPVSSRSVDLVPQLVLSLVYWLGRLILSPQECRVG